VAVPVREAVHSPVPVVVPLVLVLPEGDPETVGTIERVRVSEKDLVLEKVLLSLALRLGEPVGVAVAVTSIVPVFPLFRVAPAVSLFAEERDFVPLDVAEEEAVWEGLPVQVLSADAVRELLREEVTVREPTGLRL